MKKVIFVTCVLTLLITCQIVFAADETIITQYYPSPSGNYDTLRVGTIEGNPPPPSAIPGYCSGDIAKCYSNAYPDSGVSVDNRVRGFNADYVDGYSAEELFVGSAQKAACYCLPIFELRGVDIGSKNINLGGSVCLSKNTYIQDMHWKGTAEQIDIGSLTVFYRGTITCCRYTNPGAGCIFGDDYAAFDKFSKFIGCNYCNIINSLNALKISDNAAFNLILENIPCFQLELDVLAGECATCGFTQTNQTCLDIYTPVAY